MQAFLVNGKIVLVIDGQTRKRMKFDTVFGPNYK